MGPEGIELKNLIEVISRRRHLIYRIVAVMIGLAITFNFISPPLYQATASVRVNSRGANEAMGITLTSSEDMQRQLFTNAEIVKSPSVLEGVINQLYRDVPAAERPSYRMLGSMIQVNPIKGTSLMDIAVMAGSPGDAQIIANTVVKVYLDRMTEIARSEGKDSRVFIAERLEEARQNLDNAGKALIAYQKEQKTVSVGEQTKSFNERKAFLKSRSTENNLAIDSSQAKLTSVNQQIAAQAPGFIGDSPLIAQYKSKLAELEAELAGLQSSFTARHPKIISLQATIAENRAKLSEEVTRVVKAEAPSSNPVFLSLLQSKIQAEADLAVAYGQRDALQRADAAIEEELRSLPEREEGLAGLLRDRNVAEEAYTALAKRYGQARIDEVMQPTNVQVVDLASLPDRPVQPRKALNLIVATMLGIFVGILSAFAVDYFRKTIDSAEDVKRFLGVPGIVSIPSYQLCSAPRKRPWWKKLFSRRAPQSELSTISARPSTAEAPQSGR